MRLVSGLWLQADPLKCYRPGLHFRTGTGHAKADERFGHENVLLQEFVLERRLGPVREGQGDIPRGARVQARRGGESCFPEKLSLLSPVFLHFP